MDENISEVQNNHWTFHVHTFKIVMFSILIILGIPSNILVLVAVRKRGPSVTTSYLYTIANMAVADLLLLLLLPFDIIIQKSSPIFPLGAFMCKLLWPLQTAVFTVAVLTYTALGFQRYRAFLPQRGGFREIRSSVQIVIIWIVSVIVVIPYLIVNHFTEKRTCVEVWEKHVYRQLYTVFLFLVQYVIPMVCAIFLYWRISNYLRWCERRNIEFHKRIFRMLTIIICVFAVCTFPHHLMWLILDFSTGSLWIHFEDILNIIYIFTYTNSVANPIIFFTYNAELRRIMLNKVKAVWNKQLDNPSVDQTHGQATGYVLGLDNLTLNASAAHVSTV